MSNYGTNDLISGSSAIMSSLNTIALRSLTAGQQHVQLTLDPKTSSTDGWVSLANQTVLSNSNEGYRRGQQLDPRRVDGVGDRDERGPARELRDPVHAGEQPLRRRQRHGHPVPHAYPFVTGTESVTVAGVAKVVTTNYTYLLTTSINGVTYASGISMIGAPANGASVLMSYTKPAGFKSFCGGTSGNVGYFDTAAAVEINGSSVAGTNGGFWLPQSTAALDSGTANGTNSTSQIQDTSKTWTVNQYRGYAALITADSVNPSLVGKTAAITTNTVNVLSAAFSPAPSTAPPTRSSRSPPTTASTTPRRARP